MKKLLGFLLCTILGCLVLAQTAVAIPYQVEVNDTIKLTDYNSEVNAGVMVFEVNGKPGALETFCMEYDETTIYGHTYTVTGLEEGSYWTNWDAIAYLYYNWNQGALETSLNATQSNLQRAFWELNGDVDFGAITEPGQYTGNDDVMKIVEYALSGSTDWQNNGKVMVAVNDGQDVLVSAAPVPEPATLMLLGTGLIGLAGVSRKKFKK